MTTKEMTVGKLREMTGAIEKMIGCGVPFVLVFGTDDGEKIAVATNRPREQILAMVASLLGDEPEIEVTLDRLKKEGAR